MSVSDQTFLDNIDAALNAIITGQVQSLSASQRSLTTLGIDRLMELKERFEARVSAATEGENGGGNALVQFGDPA